MKDINRKLKVCVLSNLLLLSFVISIILLFKDDKSTYLRWGPQDDLIIISVACLLYTSPSPRD